MLAILAKVWYHSMPEAFLCFVQNRCWYSGHKLYTLACETPFLAGHYTQWCGGPGIRGLGPEDLGTWDPGTQTGMHCVYTYSSPEPR